MLHHIEDATTFGRSGLRAAINLRRLIRDSLHIDSIGMLDIDVRSYLRHDDFLCINIVSTCSMQKNVS